MPEQQTKQIPLRFGVIKEIKRIESLGFIFDDAKYVPGDDFYTIIFHLEKGGVEQILLW